MPQNISTISYKTDSDVVKTEGPNRYSRDEVILITGTVALLPGAVLGKITASGKYAVFDPSASNGSEVPDAILLETTPLLAADRTVVVLSRHAEVVQQALMWGAGVDAAEQAAALLVLKDSKGIVPRRGV